MPSAADLVSPRLVAALTEVGGVPRLALTEARQQLHHALQVVAAVGSTHLPAEDDFRHTAMRWHPVGHWLESQPLPGSSVRAGLSIPSLSLRLGDDMVRERFDLGGRTLADAMQWMHEAVQRHHPTQHVGLGVPCHDLPGHPVARGAKLEGTTVPARAELGHWFEAADALLGSLTARDGLASPVRCWPHHFDIATLIDLENENSIGVGLSPGDGSYDEPYFYVTPWPYPEADSLPELPAPGHWHTEGFTAGILTASSLAAIPAAPARAEALASFVAGAITNLDPSSA